MCIVVVSTLHPNYPFIFLGNRDEYIRRPTARAHWWTTPDEHILGGRDLLKDEHGTWFGITKQGHLSSLTNFRDALNSIPAASTSHRSRGAMVNAYLRSPANSDETTFDTAKRLIGEGVGSMGGFSLMLGRLKRPSWENQGLHANENPVTSSNNSNSSSSSRWEGMAIVSNRDTVIGDVKWLAQLRGETHALSNTSYENKTWPKVLLGEKLAAEAIEQSILCKDSKDVLIERLLETVLSVNGLPAKQDHEGWEVYLQNLRRSIFIPLIGEDRPYDGDANSGPYGTQKQTVLLVDWAGKVTYYERTLYDGDGKRISKGEGDLMFEFDIEDWV